MKLYQISKIKRCKKRPKSHVGKMEGAYHGKDQGKIDTRLTPVHRYVLQETDFPIVKVSQDMNEPMTNFFSPSITLKRHMLNGKIINGYWYVDLVKDLPVAKQLMTEAGIESGFGTKISDLDLDAFEIAAGNHGYSVETIGE